mgnify:CR=1 FL=1
MPSQACFPFRFPFTASKRCSMYASAVCLLFVGNEGISVIENLGLMGVPLPPIVKKMLKAMKDKVSSGETNKA